MPQYDVILLGHGGHAKVLLDVLRFYDVNIIGYVDQVQKKNDTPYLGTDEAFKSNLSQYKHCTLVNGIGSTRSVDMRRDIYLEYKALGFSFLTVIHPQSIISKQSVIQEGAQIMAGAVIQPDCNIGENALINTRASIDHDCKIGAHSHIAPGCVLSGNVTIGNSCHIGTGGVFIQSLTIADNSFIPAGSVITRNILDQKG